MKLFNLRYLLFPYLLCSPLFVASAEAQQFSRQQIEIYEDHVARGSTVAMLVLGRAYLYGDQMPRDREKGLALLNRCAEKNETACVAELSRYYDGSGGHIDSPDPEKARYWNDKLKAGLKADSQRTADQVKEKTRKAELARTDKFWKQRAQKPPSKIFLTADMFSQFLVLLFISGIGFLVLYRSSYVPWQPPAILSAIVFALVLTWTFDREPGLLMILPLNDMFGAMVIFPYAGALAGAEILIFVWNVVTRTQDPAARAWRFVPPVALIALLVPPNSIASSLLIAGPIGYTMGYKFFLARNANRTQSPPKTGTTPTRFSLILFYIAIACFIAIILGAGYLFFGDGRSIK